MVLGAAGQLGRELVRVLPPAETVPLTHADLDVRDAGAVATRLAALRPDVVVNTVADNRVDQAEADPTESHAINAVAVGTIARACRTHDAFLVQLSTDYVFDGHAGRPYTEDDPPAPLGAYARAKLEGERLARALAPRHAIVRVAGLYARGGSRGKGGSFVDRVQQRARAGEPLRIVADQVTAPTWARDVATTLATLVPRWVAGSAPVGIYHLTNAGACSWYDFARAVLRGAGLVADVRPITSAELAAAAPRPAYSVLADTRLPALGLEPLRSWDAALAAYLADDA